ncbi:lytic transglycosylase domain-containing protein [Bradyrhizobium sp. NP1]|uniref:lytic transglycosylase domain-containing protein n=1 Tax=Bradyrhizobium sp. NP1 TaxID=3049772 RepID=UPI0025A5CFCA|nr:lytic transglycosylase domain-containing protein [Bradyrhizobium sp. NP1]WJR80076.1 lytic transglycosylase domain-containing protein [Bradyrhizobium sp. NP1]
MYQAFRPMTCVCALLALGAFSADALARAKPAQHANKAAATRQHKAEKSSKGKHEKHAESKHAKHAEKSRHKAKAAEREPAPRPETPPLTGDLAVVKDVFDLARKGKTNDASDAAKAIGEPAARKLAEWFILRDSESTAPFNRYAAFVADSPGWPGVPRMRRRAEARLWQEKSDGATVHRFTQDQPATAKGRFALARTLLAEGDRDGAMRQAREAWRSEELVERTETEALDTFRDLVTREDHRARMDKRIGAKDFGAAMRAARRLGDDEVAIVKACAASAGDAGKALDLLDGVASDARKDLGYTLCRLHWMTKHDRLADAVRLVQIAAPETMTQQDTDEWWRERRTLARRLLDVGQYENAYDVVRDAAPPANKNYQAESHFLPGWIALRYLKDAGKARAHFAHIDDGSTDPIILARANYWRGRAAEEAGDKNAMRTAYEAAARHPTAYYGQLARARLGLAHIELRAPPQPEQAKSPALKQELVRAAEILYAIGERDVVVSLAADLGEQCTDAVTLAAIGELAGQNNDARSMLEVGKAALGRGLALDLYAFPTIGIPPHKQVGPEIELSMIYAVARTESAFNPRDRSAANAVGLMQVTPEAGRDTAKRVGVSYDWDRMVSDSVYNTQMGAAELSALWREYAGSQIMTFAGYNAGRGRVRQWVKSYGDPRDPNIDPVDWVERIPFAETRNYVQRVMENFQIYRLRFDGGTATTIAKSPERPAAAQEASSQPATAAAHQGSE